jgi:hypothetical protein
MAIAAVALAGAIFFNSLRVRVTEDAVRYPRDFTMAVAASARACFRRLLAGLHESRRRQAAIEQTRYRHLLVDPDTEISFDSRAAKQKPPPAE